MGEEVSIFLKEILRLLETPKFFFLFLSFLPPPSFFFFLLFFFFFFFFFCMTSRDRLSVEFPDPIKRERGPDLPARSGRSGARSRPPSRLPPPLPLAPHIPFSFTGSRLVFLVQLPSLGRAGGSDDVAG